MAVFNEVIALLIKANASGAVGELKTLEGQAAKTSAAWDRAGKKIGVSGAALKSGLSGMAAGVAAAAVVRGVEQMATQYANAAKAAGDLAVATGGTVEEISAMQAALADAGVSAEQSAAMITKFATAAGTAKGADTLRALNVELVRGQTGAVDYAATMTVAVDQIMALGDAAQRNTAFVALFGRQGAAAFQDLVASGLSFAEAQRAISSGRILTGNDYQNAVAFDEALDSLNASMETLANTVGRALLPAMTDASNALGDVANFSNEWDAQVLKMTGREKQTNWSDIFTGFSDGADEGAAAAARLGDAGTDADTAMEALTATIASGAISGQAFADAVAAAGDELAAQASDAALAARALDVYRASTDQAYEATLNLLSLDAGERSAQRAAEGASDAAGDAKANMDKALADANKAKTVVEKIAAIRGRERRKEEDAGIVAGSTDVRAIEGIKGRAAQTRTRVTEAAGVITPAEARQIREATRAYEQSLDDISAAWIRVGQARVAHLEALGKYLTPAEKLDQVRQALAEGLKIPGLSAEAKKDIRADLAEVTKSIQALGGVPVTIDNIKFKEGTTRAELTNLQNQIRTAGQAGNQAIVDDLSARLASLKVEGGAATDLKIALGLDPASLAATQATLGNVGIDPRTGKPYTAKTLATVDKTQAQKDLDALTKDRTMTVKVNVVPNAPDTWPTGSSGYPVTPGPRLNFGGAAPAASFAPTVNNYYPKAERASDSIASALRVARYSVGLS